jgi:hypothetical protein
MTTYEVTLKDLRQAKACIAGYNKVVCSLQGQPFTDKHRDMKSYIRFAYKEPISLSFILENNGLNDALWAMHCIKDADRDIRLFSVWCARQVQHLMRDSRSTNALDVIERFANSKATKEELEAASAAAWNAANAANVAAIAAACAANVANVAWAASAARTAQTEMFKLMCDGKAPWQVSGLD